MELTAEKAWSTICEAAEKKLPEQTCRTWLRPSKAISLSGGALAIEMPSEFAAQWVADQYGQMLNRFARVLGEPITIVFESPAPAAANEFIDFPSETDLDFMPPVGSGLGIAQPEPPPRPQLNDRYTFERFVVGGNNQLAEAACRRTSEAPATDYNPLFLYGGTGLGKTHLLHAVGHAVMARHPAWRVAYIPSEQFTNELIDAIRTGQTLAFRERYRRVDLLLIDDIQFIANKESTQEELFHTFNALYTEQRQILIASDRPPNEIAGVQDRLVSRFEWGLVAHLSPPDLETRAAILRQMVAEEGLLLEDEVIDYVARTRTTSVRHLEGAVIKLLAVSSMARREVTLELARETLLPKVYQQPEPARPATPEELREAVAERWGVTVEELCSGSRVRALTTPRQVAMYLIKAVLDLPYSEIGRLFGGRDHSTVIYAVNKVEAKMAIDARFRAQVLEIRRALPRP